MLEPAIKYKDQLEKLQYNTWFNDKYKYWNFDVYYEPMQINTDTYNKHQFVSVSDGEVIGYIAYNISRAENFVHSLSIINFTDNKITFGRDVMKAMNDIFEKFKFRKLNFNVVIGNPIEKTYDKLIEKYGGRIVGVYKENVKLIDGEYYDVKSYELLASDYFKFKYKDVIDKLNSIPEEYHISVKDFQSIGYTEAESKELLKASNVYI